MDNLKTLVESRPLVSLLSLIAGALITNFLYVYRSRVKTLSYTVVHDRVGLSANDAIFGNVAVTWRDNPVQNLYLSTLRIDNGTLSDFTALRLKAYTGNETLLLTDRASVVGTTQVPLHTQEWRQEVLVVPGQEPSEAQWHSYYHSREWLVPVLNRGQRVEFTFLTTAPGSQNGPSVWADLVHPGVKLEYRRLEPEILGAPTKLALPIGLIVCLALLVLVSVFVAHVWTAALIMLVAGLIVQSLGAAAYRSYRFLHRILLR